MRFRIDLSCDALFMNHPRADCPADVLPTALAVVREWSRMTGLAIQVDDIRVVAEEDQKPALLCMESSPELRQVS